MVLTDKYLDAQLILGGDFNIHVDCMFSCFLFSYKHFKCFLFLTLSLCSINYAAQLQPTHVRYFSIRSSAFGVALSLGAVSLLANVGHGAKRSVIPSERPSNSFNDIDIYGSRRRTVADQR